MEIKIAGWQKLSLIDYPGKMAAVIFLAGCNMRCHYCHNRQIWDPRTNQIPLDEILTQISQRLHWLDAIVISGGEPTVSPDLIPLLQKLRQLGLLIKLDTNGTHPKIVRQVVKMKLVDYVALDIKAPAAKYLEITGLPIDAVLETVHYLKSQKHVPYLLRTTLTPRLNLDDLLEIGKNIVNGAKCWQIQQCRLRGAYPDAEIIKMASSVKSFALHVVVRGV